MLFPNTHHIDLHATKLKHDTAPFHFLLNVPQLTVVCLNITLKLLSIQTQTFAKLVLIKPMSQLSLNQVKYG